MPELPEVEIICQGIKKALKGKAISSVTVRRHDLRIQIPDNLEQCIKEKTITELSRRGKYIILFTDDAQALILHLGMSGRIRIYSPHEPYTIQKHDHVLLQAHDGTHIIFHDPRRFGMLYLANAQSWDQDEPFSRMGPEPLAHQKGKSIWSASHLLNTLQNRKTSIKSALLDQSVVAGLGNIYVCEALYTANISPLRPANSLDATEAKTLVSAVQHTLKKAIEAGGSTLKDYQHTDGTLGYFQYSFSVYNQENKKCPNCTCNTLVKRIIQNGRSTFYCPSQQK